GRLGRYADRAAASHPAALAHECARRDSRRHSRVGRQRHAGRRRDSFELSCCASNQQRKCMTRIGAPPMKPRTVIYVILLLILVALLVANRTAIATFTQLNFLVTQKQAPFGILILIVAILIALVDFIVHALSRYAWQRERRNLARELEIVRGQA